MKIKEKLLSLGIFEDNEYLDFYCSLINKNKNTKREKYKTQKHHIIPKCYYTTNDIAINNEPDNIVNLLYKDHILAHYYLCLCISNNNKNLYYKLTNAYLHLIKANPNSKIKNIEDINLSKHQEIYENWRLLNSNIQKGKQSWNKGLKKETDSRVNKYAEKLKNRKKPKEQIDKMQKSLCNYYKTHSGTMLGKHLTEEQKLKVSLANKGKTRISKNPVVTKQKLSLATKQYWKDNVDAKNKLIAYNKTRVLSKDTLNKMSISQPNRIEIYQYDTDNNLLNSFKSIRECTKITGIKRYRVVSSCNTHKLLREGFYFTLKKHEEEE